MAKKKAILKSMIKKKAPAASRGTPSPSKAKLVSAGKRRDGSAMGGGIVPRRPLTTPMTLAKVPHTGGGAATPHPVRFHGPGDATNAHADTDNGSILYRAQLRVIFWGKEWASATPPVTMGEVINDVESVLAGPYLDGLDQYGISGAFVDRVHKLTNEDPPNPFGLDDAGDRVKDLIGDGTFPEPIQDNLPSVYAVFLPSKVAGKSVSTPEAGYHSNYLNFDWGDFDISYVHVAWAGNDGTRQGISSNFTHELVETLTDPDGSGWQVDPRSSFNWNEICDVCQSTAVLNGVTVSSYWSNRENACIITDSAFTTFKVQWIWRPRRIEWMGGVDQDGNAWQFPRQMVMDRIRRGDQFKVDGQISGKESSVGIYYLDPTHPYLATNTDGVPDDNLLALPQRLPT